MKCACDEGEMDRSALKLTDTNVKILAYYPPDNPGIQLGYNTNYLNSISINIFSIYKYTSIYSRVCLCNREVQVGGVVGGVV